MPAADGSRAGKIGSMPQSARALPLLLVAVAALPFSGCSSGAEESGGSGKSRSSAPKGGTTEKIDAPRVDSTTSEVKKLLDEWAKELVPAFHIQRSQQRAYAANDPKRGASYAPRLGRLLAPLESWGPEGRATLAELPPTKPVRTAIEVGNAWASWANKVRSNIAKGTVTQKDVEESSELRTKAIQLHFNAYLISAEPVAEEFTRPPIGATESEKRKAAKKRERQERRKARERRERREN
jgi:hypothetical protein